MEWAVTELAPGHGVQQVSRRYHQFAGRDNVGRHLAMHAASNVGVYHINRREAVGILGSPCAVRQRVDRLGGGSAYGIALQLDTQRVPVILGDNERRPSPAAPRTRMPVPRLRR